MAGSLLGYHRKNQTSKISFSMEQTDRRDEIEHVIDITSTGAVSSSISHDRSLIVPQQHQPYGDEPSTSARVSEYRPTLSTASGRSNSRSASLVRRGSGRTRRRSPLNSGIWISVELVLTVSQIVAAIVVLSLSRNEHPHAPLSAWVVGYASGCVAVLPLLYWRYHHRNQGSDRGPSQSHQGSSNGNLTGGQYSTNRVSEAVDDHATDVTPPAGTTFGISTARLKRLIDYFKMALDCFFAIWFVVGNVWIFGGHTSASDAPKLYRLCIVFLTFSCIGYAMPFILCATICCCLPCIISVLGFREDPTQSRGATSESINSLPTYKFKVKKNKTIIDKESNNASGDGGIIAAGTEKERVISGDDAVCCICLAKYVNNDELKELLCSHFFHKECVDKWLKINATCPLCKAEVGETLLGSLTEATASLRQGTIL
ncbi:hypothetical protein LIER_00079 [Lithospermum erythrorhizon]|uniref:RING-type domain-containing protein n=1 Tax=Lithospermum erythrorhizon TaxID=34254 RepID=A0AAV3NHN8_LITER